MHRLPVVPLPACLLLLGLTGLMVGCDRSDTATGEAHRSAEAFPDDLQAMWKKASVNRALQRVDHSIDQAVTYQADPDCPLVYDFQATVSNSLRSPLHGAPPRTQEIAGRFEIRAETDTPDRLGVFNRATGRYRLRDGVRYPGQEYWPGQLAKVELENTGHRLCEVNGPTSLWSAFGTFPGLIYFWPDLPTSPALSSVTGWNVPLNAEPAVGANRAMPAGAFQHDQIDAEVRLAEWITIDGEQAAVFEAQQAFAPTRTPSPATSGESIEWSGALYGRYVVLATGRLLHGAISRSITARVFDASRDSERPVRVHRQRLQGEARLTTACDGVTLPTIRLDRTKAEAAMETFIKLSHALNAGEFDQLDRFLAPDILNAHGDDAVTDVLRAHLAAFGPEVLGGPSISDAVDTDGDLLRFRLIGRAHDFYGPRSAMATVITHVTAEAVDDGVTILAIRTTSDQNSEDWNVLDLSSTRLYSRAVDLLGDEP